MFSIVSEGWFAVSRSTGYTWLLGARGAAEAEWFRGVNEALDVARRMTNAGVRVRIVEISSSRPRRVLKVAVYCGNYYLARAESENKHIWKKCLRDIVIGPDVALFNTEGQADALLKILAEDGRGAVGGAVPVVLTISI